MSEAVYLSAGPWPEPQLLTVTELPTAVAVVDDVAMDELSGHFDRTFAAFGEAVGTGRIAPAAPPLALYNRMSSEQPPRVDVEIGFVTAESLAEPVEIGGVRIQASRVPGGDVMVMTHLGSYAELSTAWGTLMAAIVNSGREPGIPFWEVYITEPTPDADPATMRTDLYCRLA